MLKLPTERKRVGTGGEPATLRERAFRVSRGGRMTNHRGDLKARIGGASDHS